MGDVQSLCPLDPMSNMLQGRYTTAMWYIATITLPTVQGRI